MNQNEVTNHDAEILVLDESIYDDIVTEARHDEDSNIEDITEIYLQGRTLDDSDSEEELFGYYFNKSLHCPRSNTFFQIF